MWDEDTCCWAVILKWTSRRTFAAKPASRVSDKPPARLTPAAVWSREPLRILDSSFARIQESLRSRLSSFHHRLHLTMNPLTRDHDLSLIANRSKPFATVIDRDQVRAGHDVWGIHRNSSGVIPRFLLLAAPTQYRRDMQAGCSISPVARRGPCHFLSETSMPPWASVRESVRSSLIAKGP